MNVGGTQTKQSLRWQYIVYEATLEIEEEQAENDIPHMSQVVNKDKTNRGDKVYIKKTHTTYSSVKDFLKRVYRRVF